MTAGRRATRGRQYRRNREIVLRGSTVCHVCGHDGADATDHVVPVAKGGTDALGNLRPIHHAQPCTTCGVQCNYVKRDHDFAPVIRHSATFVRPGSPGGASPAPSQQDSLRFRSDIPPTDFPHQRDA